VVARSDAIVAALREAAVAADAPELLEWLRALPRHLVAEIGAGGRTHRVGVVHGDPEQLAGWGLGIEAMSPPDEALRRRLGCGDEAPPRARLPPTPLDTLRRWCELAEVEGLLSTHTCLPFGQLVPYGGRRLAVPQLAFFNNGAAGMPNFEGASRTGVITRVSADPTPPADSLYGATVSGGLRYDAVPVQYDHEAWLREFEAVWPEGSDAHASYHARLLRGCEGFTVGHAARAGVRRYVDADWRRYP